MRNPGAKAKLTFVSFPPFLNIYSFFPFLSVEVPRCLGDVGGWTITVRRGFTSHPKNCLQSTFKSFTFDKKTITITILLQNNNVTFKLGFTFTPDNWLNPFSFAFDTKEIMTMKMTITIIIMTITKTIAMMIIIPITLGRDSPSHPLSGFIQFPSNSYFLQKHPNLWKPESGGMFCKN